LVVPTRHGNSRAVPTPRANKSSHVAGSAPFLADTVGQSHSLNDATNMNTKRTTHGDQWSPCVVRRAGHDKQYPDLLPCPTDDARTAEKPVGRAPKKGYATPLLPNGCRILKKWGQRLPRCGHIARLRAHRLQASTTTSISQVLRLVTVTSCRCQQHSHACSRPRRLR